MDARTRLALVVILAALTIAIVVAAVAGSAHAGTNCVVSERCQSCARDRQGRFDRSKAVRFTSSSSI
jgi:hypothetical protein